jgi:predicted nucleic acid-binding protein
VIVVDASVLANAVGDDGADGAHVRAALAGQDVSVPDLVDVEVVSVLRRRWLAKTISGRRFATAIHDQAALPAVRYPVLPFMPRAFELRQASVPTTRLTCRSPSSSGAPCSLRTLAWLLRAARNAPSPCCVPDARVGARPITSPGGSKYPPCRRARFLADADWLGCRGRCDFRPGESLVACVGHCSGQQVSACAMRLARICRVTALSPSQ